jgi:CubicO group peptidase (beta-lactamase class C family)
MNPNTQPLSVPGNGEIREMLAKRIDQQKQAVGIVVGVIEPAGRRVVAYGNSAKGDPRPLDGDTIFEIGSISKVFTSLLLTDMVNRKEVALDDPAATYLPEHVKVPERNGKSITLLHLSTHSSGLPLLPDNVKLNLKDGEVKDLADLFAFYGAEDLYEFLSSYTLPRDPGSEIEYSNLGAGLLGHVLARRAGTDYETLLRSRVTQPLGMPDTGITFAPSMKQRMASGHKRNLSPATQIDWDPSHALTGAGALRSSANDMLTFLEACLGYKETSLAPAMKAMLEVRRPLGKGSIGLGWFIFPTDDREIANHDGGTGGFSSWAGYDPKGRTGAVVLANTFTPTGVADIGVHLLNPKLPLADIEIPRERTEVPIDPKILDHYTGRYRMGQGTLEITRDGDRLFAQVLGQVNGQPINGPKFELFAEGEKHFFARVADVQIALETGPEGRATSLILRRAGRDMPAYTRIS